MKLKYFFALFLVILLFTSSGCGGGNSNNFSVLPDDDRDDDSGGTTSYLTSADIDVQTEVSNSADGEHAIEADGVTVSYSNYGITKTGDASTSTSDEADFYGNNSAVFATNGATLTLTDSLVITDGSHANAVFSYGEGTTINVEDSVILTHDDNSGGIMTTGGGTMNAKNLTIETEGGSSAAIRSDRGGGTVSVEGGSYTASGRGSPAIYSTADITVKSARLESKAAQGVVIEGNNSVSLISSDLIADNNTQNGNNSTRYQAIMIYQSGSGDASEGKGTFTMKQGTITNANGDIFFVNNTVADITLEDADITNNDSTGVFMRAEAAGWGTSGSNGGKVNLYAVNQSINGDIVVDDISVLNMYLSGDSGSSFAGALNEDNSDGEIYVEISEGSIWSLTGNSYITSLTCTADGVNLNGHTLSVNGTAYTEGNASIGEAIEISTGGGSSGGEGGGGGTPPDGGNSSGDHTPPDGGTPPDDGGPGSGDKGPGGNTSGDHTPGGDGPGGDGSSDTTSNDTSMTFDSTNYTTGTVNNVSYRAYTNLVYVANPVNENYQRMSIFIPEAYISGGTINGYTASTAPIFMPNNVGGYMAGNISSPSSSNSAGQALAKGLVVVSPALRGRNVDNGTAPACIVDYKAAVRYLRANKSRLPAGNTDRIISSGTSAGGAISALLGATGNSSDYDEWLNALGAANASDDIYASMCYCPITNLDNADGAYEWMFGTGTTASNALRDIFITYINSLGLTDDGVGLTLNSDGTSGSFYDFIAEVLKDSAEDALEDGTSISESWITISNGQVTNVDLSVYGSTRGKNQIPAFDRLDLSSAENNEFGDKHFTTYGYSNSTAGGTMADSALIKVMNPMNYIGSATTAKYWRIRHGTKDTDTSLAIPAILAQKLKNNNCDVDFKAAWGEPHGGDYDLDELFDWIDDICK
ncbi:MAG: hypothetical protein IJQ77_04245 [Synergistaceae bacterium]|nr:hypothetical protein [Synergistaceae bacterium]